MAQSLNSLLEDESMKILLDIQLELKELSVEQKHIKKDIECLTNLRTKDADKIKTMHEKIQDISTEVKDITTELDNKKLSKKENRGVIIQWITTLCAVGTLVAYLTYEIGLHKPQPSQNNQHFQSQQKG